MEFYENSSHLFIVLIVIVIQEMNGTVSVHCFVVPRVIRHVVHQALQGAAASEIFRNCTCWDDKKTTRVCYRRMLVS